MSKTLGVLFVMVATSCALSLPAGAQSNNPCLATQTWWAADGPAPYGWFYYSSYPGTYAILIGAWSISCPPPPPPCPCNGGKAGQPISLATGNTYIQENDVTLPGLGRGITLTRTWNSLWAQIANAYQIGIFGPHWRSTYEERVFIGSDQYVRYLRDDGSIWSFGVNAGQWGVAGPANINAHMTSDNTSVTIVLQSGEKRVFSRSSGQLTQIIDRNGNTTSLTYDSLNRLTTVTDPTSRHLYFAYGGAGYLVSNVTSDFGVSLSYSYDSLGRLSQVTEPDSSTVSFQYDTNSFISTVLDSNGHTLESHTYDASGRGLTSSRAGGVESVTISY